MKTFQSLVEETNEIDNLEELEAAADLFEFGIEKGYYTQRQASDFNAIYWKIKNRCIAFELSSKIKINTLDLISIVSSAPIDIKDDQDKLIEYVNGRIKALKGIKGVKK